MSPSPSAVCKEIVRRRPMLVSIVAGVMAMLLMAAYIKRREAELLFIADPVRVAVASIDIPMGAMLDASMVELQEYPRRFVAPGAIVTMTQALEKVARVPLVRGMQITEGLVVTPGRESGVAVAVPEGMRAVTLAVDDITGAAGLVKPGHRVDILATFDFGDEAISRKSTTLLMQDVMVLAVGDRMVDETPRPSEEGTGGGLFGGLKPAQLGRRDFSNVTLAAMPRDAQSLVFAQESGLMTLLVRGRGDHESVRTTPATIETLAGMGSLMRQRRPAYREYRGR